MNRIKSIYISTFLTAALTVTVIAIVRLVSDGVTLGWGGVLLTTLPNHLYFVNIFRYTTARTTQNLTTFTAPIALGFITAVFGTLADDRQTLPLAIATAMFFLWMLYVTWYSRLERPLPVKLAAGRYFPSVTFEDGTGTAVSTSSHVGQKVMYLFYRGNWCPFCMAQIREIAAQYRELDQRGVRVALVSPQPHKQTASLAAKLEVPMLFLVDVENRVARELGIAHDHGVPAGMEVLGYESETVLPTVVLVNESGQILYTNQTDNYRIRPEPAEFLRVLDRLSA
ncbi:MAG: redoxin domain-containing protein [Chloroflexi bacterium]|nr:redoxin domain-containing protein [Chloroflexota bacterium]